MNVADLDTGVGWSSANVGSLVAGGVAAMTWTNEGPVLPSYTTAERDALTATAGLVVLNSTTNKVNAYLNGAWEAITSA
jgi:hypothetical protein